MTEANISLYIYIYIYIFRNPNSPSSLETTWPQYTANRGEYIGLSPNLTVRSQMRPEKMALWNTFLPSQLTFKPTTGSQMPTATDKVPDNTKGVYS